MITGITSAIRHLKPSVDVFATEIETAAPLIAALNAGDVTKIQIKKSWIDGIGHANVMKEMWPLVKDAIDGSIVATLKETTDALKLLIERNHFICEGASATALAAALWHYHDLVQQGKAGLRRQPGKGPIKVVAILTGAGIDNQTIVKCLNETL